MSQGRFALLVVVLAMAVAAVSFAAGLQVLDDGRPDPPPAAGSVDTTATTPPPVDASSTTTAVPATTPPGALDTPAWITVVASEASQGMAEEAAALVAAKGYPTGVLHSDDYTSLTPGLWVAYAGPYPDAAAADTAIADLAADGFPGAYVRCAGSKEECGADRGDDDD
jgi:hypothetical protein